MNIEADLNLQQYKAATSNARHLRIIAGAGTGKTRTLTYRLAYQIKSGISPDRILAVTFTNKAAKEMKDRTSKLLSDEGNFGSPLVCTFHSFCYKFLVVEHRHLKNYQKSFSVCDESEKDSLFDEIFDTLSFKLDSKEKNEIKRKISYYKNRGLTNFDIDVPFLESEEVENPKLFLLVFSRYQQSLAKNSMMDFDDLLLYTLYLLDKNENIRKKYSDKFDSILVDEFQDTNNIQYEIVKLLLKEDTYLTIVGDPDQNIYTFRGAVGDIIKKYIKDDFDDLETVVLSSNYRSTQNILDVANNVISYNDDRVPKDLTSYYANSGEKVYYQPFVSKTFEANSIAREIIRLHEMEHVLYKDIAIIYRANYLSLDYEKELMKHRLPYNVLGGLKFFSRAEIKDAISYLQLAIDKSDISFKRVLKAPKKGIGQTNLQKAIDYIKNNDLKINLIDLFRDLPEEIKISKASRESLNVFYKAYDEFCKTLDNFPQPYEICDAIDKYYSETGFYRYISDLDASDDDLTHSEKKMDNIRILLNEIKEYFEENEITIDGVEDKKDLSGFISYCALTDASDDTSDKDNDDKIVLMTCHVSKGLEFKNVFIPAVNQDIFPSKHALTSITIEEERRMFYVAITRAKERLYISYFQSQRMYPYDAFPSLFIKEIFKKRKDKEELTFKKFPANKTFESEETTEETDMPVKRRKEKIKRTVTSGNNSYHYSNKENNSTTKTQFSDKNKDIKVGDVIIHDTFGKGVIIDVNNNKMKVMFENYNEPKLILMGFNVYHKMKVEN